MGDYGPYGRFRALLLCGIDRPSTSPSRGIRHRDDDDRTVSERWQFRHRPKFLTVDAPTLAPMPNVPAPGTFGADGGVRKSCDVAERAR